VRETSQRPACLARCVERAAERRIGVEVSATWTLAAVVDPRPSCGARHQAHVRRVPRRTSWATLPTVTTEMPLSLNPLQGALGLDEAVDFDYLLGDLYRHVRYDVLVEPGVVLRLGFP